MRTRFRHAPYLLQVAVILCVAAHAAWAKEPLTPELLQQFYRIDDPQISPDGRTVAFTAQLPDLAANTKPSAIYTVPLDGGPPKRITEPGSNNSRPRWMPDGKHLTFVSDRSNGSQIWWMNPDGSEPKPLTDMVTEAQGQIVSPDGKTIAFVSEVFPSCAAAEAKPGVIFDRVCNKTNLDAESANKMKARVYTGLLYRHWTSYQGQRRQHIMLQALAAGGDVRDITPGSLSIPPFSLGGPEAYVFLPDSTGLTYVANTDEHPASSTNSDIFAVPVTGGEAHRLTTNPGADDGPAYSPDGRYLAYRTQTRAGYESDQWKLAILDLSNGSLNTVTDALDRWVEEFTWSHDSQRIFFTVQDHGASPLLLISPTGGSIRTVAQGPTAISSVSFTADDKTMVFAEQSGSRPVELKKAISKGGTPIALTHLNDDLLARLDLQPLEKMTAPGPDGSTVEAYIAKPPGFTASVRYPALFLIHGGPESEWGDSWTYRWNAQVFAGAGYVVVLPNPRGSVGYGQAFTDAVNKDWGGRPFEDIMAVVDKMTAQPYIDRDRMAVAGASYGGFMTNWILGHTDRFRAVVTHAGIFNLASEAAATEELWFPKWEFDGLPWDDPEMYAKWSPSGFVKSFRTPTLVTHGEIDYRVPVNQAQELFTALQESHIPSKLILFPDEGHWILKPQNSVFWYKNVLDWLEKYTKSSSAEPPSGSTREPRH